MNRENSHIESYLDYYCSLNNAPGFAVMLSGTQGVGKSWLIAQYRKKLRKNGHKSLYVSLFGINSLSEIENACYEQLNPILAEEGMGLSAKILKEAIKSTINVELKREKLATTPSENYNLPEYLANAKEYILIIDDVDRCFLSIPETFGFFNYLLEHHGFKVIIVGNENALQEREDNRHVQELMYQRVKDKVVGRTFEVKADFAEAFNNVMDYLEDDKTREFLQSKRHLIKELFIKAVPANLRHLQHSLLDFERAYLALPDKGKNNELFLKQFITLFLIFSLETRAKNVQIDDLKGIRLEFHARVFSKFIVYERKSPQSYLLEKYRKFNIQETLFSENWWVGFFRTGKLQVDEMVEDLNNCSIFFDETTPAIKQMSKLWSLSDQEFISLNRKIQIEIASKKYVEPGAIKLAASFLFWASDQGISNKSKPEILIEMKKYVETLEENNLFQPDRKISIDEIDLKSWHGIPFFTVDMREFQEFCEFIEKANQRSCQKILSNQASNLLEKLKNQLEEFCSIMTFSQEIGSQYRALPILSHIQPQDFFQAFMALSPDKQLYLVQSLQERYYLARASRQILPEAPWLGSLIVLFKKLADERKGQLSGFTIKTIIEKYLEPSLEWLETLQMEKME